MNNDGVQVTVADFESGIGQNIVLNPVQYLGFSRSSFVHFLVSRIALRTETKQAGVSIGLSCHKVKVVRQGFSHQQVIMQAIR
jgi:hypothetical protein